MDDMEKSPLHIPGMEPGRPVAIPTEVAQLPVLDKRLTEKSGLSYLNMQYVTDAERYL